jgi:hypothetical protein
MGARQRARNRAAILAVIKTQSAHAGDADALRYLADREPRAPMLPLDAPTVRAHRARTPPPATVSAGSMQFAAFADLVARQVRRRLPAPRV